MISSERLTVGAKLRIEINGERLYLKVVDIKDGRVILSNAEQRRRGRPSRWWLPYALVRKEAWLAS